MKEKLCNHKQFILFAFYLGILSFFYRPAKAQNDLAHQFISLNVVETPLQDVLTQIEQQTDLLFAYNPDKIPVHAQVSLKTTQTPLSEILQLLGTRYHFSYKVFEKQIALVVNPNNPTLYFQITGKLNNKITGEALIGATLWEDSLKVGTSTNGYGFFSLRLPYGKHIIQSSYVGFDTQIDTISLYKAQSFNTLLTPSRQALNEVVIQSPRVQLVDEIQTGKAFISTKMAGEISAALGESDVLKSLSFIPGIKLQSEGSTFFYVRGGNKDQNLILIDDAPIYNPTHMFGLISTLSPETLNAVDVYKSDFPLGKGGRLSSVIDIKTKEGNKHHFSGWGNLGLISTQLGIEGPLKKEVSSFILSGRFSRIKWFLANEFPELEKANFYDLTGKFNAKINIKNTLYASFYTGSDKFLTTESGLEWANFNGSVRWNTITKNSFINTTLFGSNYEYLFHYDRSAQTSWRSRIGEIGIKTDISNNSNKKVELDWGVSITGRTINPGNLVGTSSLPKELIVSVKNNLEIAAYAQSIYKVSDKWGLKIGIRVSNWNSMGEAFELNFNKNGQPTDTTNYVNGELYHSFLTFEPHTTVNYRLNSNSSVKLSFDHTIQNLHLITSSVSPFTSFEVWLPSGPNINPQKANQWAIGYYHLFPNSGISLQLEPYIKQMTNQIDYQSHPKTLLNPSLENQLVVGKTSTWGIEFQAKKEIGKWRGILGYTYAKAMSTFSMLNKGNSFTANSDRPYYISATLQFDPNNRITVSSNFMYTSGIPFSSPTSFYLFNGSEIPVYSSKNNSRMPEYHRLDIAVKFILNKPTKSKFTHSLTASIYNVYGRKNPIFINFNKTQINDTIVVPTNVLNANRLTTQQFIYGLVPAINYQFRF